MSALLCAAPRRGLCKARRQVARLGQEEPADLRDVGAGGDMHQVILALGIEGIAADELVQRAVDLLKIPGIAQGHGMQTHLGFRRDRSNIVAYAPSQPGVTRAVDQLEAIDQQILLLTQANAGPPLAPAIGTLADSIQGGTDKANGNGFLSEHAYTKR